MMPHVEGERKSRRNSGGGRGMMPHVEGERKSGKIEEEGGV